MKFIQGNYYLIDFPKGEFDGVITDPPYKQSIKNQLNEQNFDTDLFMQKTDMETKDVAFLITFGNFINAVEFVIASRRTRWQYHTVQVWDKRPTAKPIAETYPRKHTEFIVYFKKGDFKYRFLTGEVKAEGYERGSIGVAGLYGEKGRKGADVKPALSRFDDVLTLEEIEGMDEQIPVAAFTGRKIGEGKKAPRDLTEFVVAANGDIIRQVVVTPTQKLHQVHKPKEFSWYFSKIVGSTGLYVIDPFCGSTTLLTAFKNGVGIDLKDWRSGVQYKVEKIKGKAEAVAKKLVKQGYEQQGSEINNRLKQLVSVSDDDVRINLIGTINELVNKYEGLITPGVKASEIDEEAGEAESSLEAKRDNNVYRHGVLRLAPKTHAKLRRAYINGREGQ